jgi:hypothetical protein
VGVPQITAVSTRLKRWKAPVFRLSLTAVSASLAISPKRSPLALLP